MTEQEIAVMLTKHDSAIETLEKRVDKAENTIEQIHELTLTVQKVADKQDSIVEKMDTLSTTVTGLSNAPAEKWNKATTAILTGAIGTVIAAIVTAIIAILK